MNGFFYTILLIGIHDRTQSYVFFFFFLNKEFSIYDICFL